MTCVSIFCPICRPQKSENGVKGVWVVVWLDMGLWEIPRGFKWILRLDVDIVYGKTGFGGTESFLEHIFDIWCNLDIYPGVPDVHSKKQQDRTCVWFLLFFLYGMVCCQQGVSAI